MDPIIRRRSYGVQPDYNPMAREYEERGIEACLAVNPLGSVDLGDSSAIATSPYRNQSNNSSFWNDKWRTTEERFSLSRPGVPEGVQNVAEEEEQEIAFFPPSNFGLRNVNLSRYYSTRFTQALFGFTATHCFVLLLYRLLAVILLLSCNSSILWTIPYFFAIVLSSIPHCSIYLRDYVKTPSETDTRFQSFLSIFTAQNLSEWLKFILGGSLISWVFASQIGSYYLGPILFTGDLNRPDKHTKFLNEESLYIIVSGAWFGSTVFFQRHFDFTRPRIKFPIIQRLKFHEFKAKARPTLQKSFKNALWPAVWFTLAYHFLLYDIKTVVVSASLFLDSPTWEIERTWYQLFNVRRFVVMYFSGVMTLFSFRMAKILARIFMLAPLEFGMELYDENQQDLSLMEAIGEVRVPLVRALALKCLLGIAVGQDQDSKNKRRKIFALNPIGDVPSNWRAVSRECHSTIERFSSKLDGLKVIGSKNKWMDDTAPVLPVHLAMQAMRNKLYREQLTEKRKAMSLLDRLNFESKQLVSKMPWLMYIFDFEKENQFLRLTRDSDELLFSVRILSCLVSYSIDEDRYGVVQGDIPQILASLENLRAKLTSLRRVNSHCADFAIFIHRSLIRIWLSFPDSFGAEALKRFH